MVNMKLLVTGGAGFIGSNFVRHAMTVYPKWEIVNLDALTYAGNPANYDNFNIDPPERYTFVHGNICDIDLLDRLFSEHRFDAVVHFAAESHVDRSILGPEAFLETNVIGTFRLLETARKYWNTRNKPDHFRFVHVSTDEVYGSLGPEGFFVEDTPYDPSSPYSASKAASDHFVRAYHRTYGLPTIITNCSNNYGPFQFPEKLIPLMIINIVENQWLPVYGDGKNVRDWLYVIDHCEALITVLEKGAPGQTYNIGGGAEKKNIDIVHLLCDLIDEKLGRGKQESRKLIRFVTDRPGHDRRYAIDAAKIRTQLGWQPGYRFEDGLKATIDWYCDNMTWVNSIKTGEYLNWIDKNYTKRA